MSRWSDIEFQRVALSTKLSERTLAACREVLVDGVVSGEVAARYEMFPAHLSRSIGTLKDKRLSMVETAETMKTESTLLKFAATQVAKALMGEAAVVIDAQPGRSYDGWILATTPGFVIQKIGRTAVVHDLGKFEESPKTNSATMISYPDNGMKAVLSASALEDRRKTPER